MNLSVCFDYYSELVGHKKNELFALILLLAEWSFQQGYITILTFMVFNSPNGFPKETRESL